MTNEPINVWAPNTRADDRIPAVSEAFNQAWNTDDPVRFLHRVAAGFHAAWATVLDPTRTAIRDNAGALHITPTGRPATNPDTPSSDLPCKLTPQDTTRVFVHLLTTRQYLTPETLATHTPSNPSRDEVAAAVRDGWPARLPGHRLGQIAYNTIVPWVDRDAAPSSAYGTMREMEDGVWLALLTILAGQNTRPEDAGRVWLAGCPSLVRYTWVHDPDQPRLVRELPYRPPA